MSTTGFSIQRGAAGGPAPVKMPSPATAFPDLLTRFGAAVWTVNNGSANRHHHPTLTSSEVGMVLAKLCLDATSFLRAYLATDSARPVLVKFLEECERSCADCRGKPADVRLACALLGMKAITLNDRSYYVALNVSRVPADLAALAGEIFAARPDGAALAARVATDVQESARGEKEGLQMRAAAAKATADRELTELRRVLQFCARLGWDGEQPIDGFLAEFLKLCDIAGVCVHKPGFRGDFDALCSRVVQVHGADVLTVKVAADPRKAERTPPKAARPAPGKSSCRAPE